jgi:ABC-type multidrug transport system permease subunit
MNHFSSIIISDISDKNSLRNATSSSGSNFSEIVVNHSISEKYIAKFFLSQSKFIFHEFDNTSSAIAFETYSESALFNLFLFLFSTIYFTVFEIVRDNTRAKNSSNKWFKRYDVNIRIVIGNITKNIDVIAILLKTST